MKTKHKILAGCILLLTFTAGAACAALLDCHQDGWSLIIGLAFLIGLWVGVGTWCAEEEK